LRFLLDMGISKKVGFWLQNGNHNVLNLSEVGLHALPDIDIIRKSVDEKRIILTSDMDFGQILALTKLSSISVIQFRVSDFTSANIIYKLDLLFDKFSDQLETGYLITVEDNRIRSRRLPI